MAYVLTVRDRDAEEFSFHAMAQPQFLFETKGEVVEVGKRYQETSERLDRGLDYSHEEVNNPE